MKTILGVDPGPQCGLVLLKVDGGRVVGVLRGIGVDPNLDPVRAVAFHRPDLVAVENFTLGNATMKRTRSGSMAAIGQLEGVKRAATLAGLPCIAQPLQAKGWASDARLRSWRLGGPDGPTLHGFTAGGGGHDRDAMRHALYAAVRRRWLPAVPTS